VQLLDKRWRRRTIGVVSGSSKLSGELETAVNAKSSSFNMVGARGRKKAAIPECE